MLKNYYPGIWAISIKKACQNFVKDIGEIERMLKALIKSIENKHLNP